MNMKTIAEIDPTMRMEKNDFLTLFSHLPLLDDEKFRLELEYFEIYETFMDNDVEPTTAWLGTRQIFYNKEKQIGSRMNANSNVIGIAGAKSLKK